VRGTYLLDGEAGVMLVIVQLFPQTRDEKSKPWREMQMASATYLTMFAVLVLFFPYENSVVES
jgi:hypothetical protein